jgi:hypothetical protein
MHVHLVVLSPGKWHGQAVPVTTFSGLSRNLTLPLLTLSTA